LACSCSAVTISPGSQLPENLTLTGVNGFTGTVHLTTSITPTVSGGPTVSLNQANQTLTNGQNTIATLTIAGGNFAGMFTLTFSGACLTGACTMPDQQHSTNLSLMIASTGSSGGGGGGGSGRIMML
ncbi:MAG TPA: hypothetical protein VFE96_08635, partial [Candidatus Bathyarchaeia archaeon]|nr:hypothetical protein [Candidatus Bathyarchaeia archaeon]